MVDWKELLPEDVKKSLADILNKTKKYRYAYLESNNSQIAQLWIAISYLNKQLEEIKEILGKVQEPFKAIIEVGEEEKRKTIERIVEEIIKPTDEETQKATKKLVETLMKF